MASPQESQRRDPPDEQSNRRLSPPRSIPGTPGGRGKKKVGFYAGLDGTSPSDYERTPPREAEQDASRNHSITYFDDLSQYPTRAGGPGASLDELQLTRSLNKLKGDSTPTVLKSALRKGMSSRDNRPEPLDLEGINDLSVKLAAEHHARARATGLERDVASAPTSRSGSPSRSRNRLMVQDRDSNALPLPSPGRGRDPSHPLWSSLFHRPSVGTGQNTPDVEELEEYFPEPQKYRSAGLSTHLLSNWWRAGNGSNTHSRASSIGGSAPSSPGTLTPSLHVTPPGEETPPDHAKSKQAWPWSRSPRKSDFGVENMVSAAASSTALGGSDISSEYRKQAGSRRPDNARSGSTTSLSDFFYFQPRKSRKSQVDITIKKHIQETQVRKKYILKLCRALMEYGAPTHRLEAYLAMTSRVLEIEAQFLYFPGTMLISFDDARTHTAEMKLVRVNQGVDLGKMKDTHNVYKDVSHDLIGVEEGVQRLEEISKKKDQYPIWLRILAFGLGSATVAPFAFEARLIDMGPCFGLGIILGLLQLVVAPKSDLYAAVFEIAATIVTSFLSRLLGSISDGKGGYLFCFSALAQSSIALILPGFTVLSAALELQSRSIVAGSVRIVYAIVYSLWIGYGLTIGTAIYGAIDETPSSDAYCTNPLSSNDRKWIFLFVPVYTLCLAIINQAKWRQMPMMILISFVGYQVNYWASTKFQGNAQVASTLGAAAIGVLANGYSRAGRHIDEHAARFRNWFGNNVATRLPDYEGKQSSAKSQLQRRKDSIADSLISLLPAPIRPKRAKETESDVEAPDVSSFHEAKGSDIPDVRPSTATHNESSTPNPDTTGLDPEKQPDSSGESSPKSKPANEPQSDAAGPDSTLSANARTAKGVRIGRDGKPKHVNYVLAAAAMLPAIFVQVPSGVSVAGSLVSGIEAANQLTQNTNATSSTGSGIVSATDVTASNGNVTANISFTVATSVVQVAIGITIGLFFGSIFVYPTGKGGSIGHGKNSRTGMFTF